MHISLIAPTIDLNGHMRIRVRPSIYPGLFGLEKRGSVTKTLDGGVEVFDGGATYAGKDINIVAAEVDHDIYEFFAHMVEYYSLIYYASPEGYFSAFPKKASYQSGNPSLLITIIEKMSV